MKPEVTEISYTVQVWNSPLKPRAWSHYGQGKTLPEALARRDVLRRRFKRVRIMEHKRTATVVASLIAALIVAGCRDPNPPALMSPATRAEADALMRPKVSLLPSVSKVLTSRAATHPPPVAITNVTVTWNLQPMPAILQSIQGPAGNVHPVTFLVASTNGWRSQYQATPDMVYAPSNGIVRRMIQNEQFRAGYKFTR